MSQLALIQAHSHHVRQNYTEAIQFYNQALTSNDLNNQYEKYDLLIDRAIAFIQLNDLQSAKQDIQDAIVENSQRYEAYYQLGIIKFRQGNHQASILDFNHALKLVNDSSQFYVQNINVWLQKANSEIESKHFKPVIQEVEQQQPQQQLNHEEQQIIQQRDLAQYVQSASGKIAYKWYQTEQRVGIVIKYKIEKKESIKHKFEDKKLEFSFPLSEGSNYELNLDLLYEIEPQQSTFQVSLDQIEIIMIKKQKKLYWDQLEEKEVEQSEQQTQANDEKQIPIISGANNQPKKIDPSSIPQQTSYPSSSLKKKDWSKIDRELDDELKDQKGDPLNDLFRQIYGNADENTRKAMIKSFQTSGGTVLSTNWDEVKQKEYDGKDKVDPPKGQQWANWK